MPFCPDCRTEVSEETRFCPECGRPLVVIGQAVKGKDKKKIAGIIVACIIAIIVIATIATRPPTSMEPEPAIPAHFTTYTDEQGLFSISSPPEWQLALEDLDDVTQAIEDIMNSIESDLPMDVVRVVFMAGLPIAGGYMPNVTVMVAPCPTIICTHDTTVRAEVEALKATYSSYRELSRVKTTVDGRTATILVYEVPVYGITFRYVQMLLLMGGTEWCITCTTLPDEYREWEDDFDAVVRSLRILK